MLAFTGGQSVNKFATNPKSQSSDPNEFVSVDLNDRINEYFNPLLRYENVSWKAKVYTYSAKDMRMHPHFKNKPQQYVLAETSVTGRYSIDEIEINSVPPGSYLTKNSTALSVTLKISELGSMRLYDDLQIASSKLGFNQFSDLPIVLQITFHGYDRLNDNQPVIIPGATRTWALRFNNIQARLENSGSVTVYTMNCTPNMFMMPSDEWRVGQQIELVGSVTVGSFIKELESKINTVWDSQYGYLTQLFANELRPDNYITFKIHPSLDKMKVIHDSAQDTTSDSARGQQQGTKKFTISSDSTIGNIIDYIMDAAFTEKDTEGNLKRQFVHVIPVAKYIGFDT